MEGAALEEGGEAVEVLEPIKTVFDVLSPQNARPCGSESHAMGWIELRRSTSAICR